MEKIKLFGVIGLILLALILFGCTAPAVNENKFLSVQGGSICKLDGKPVIRMYSTSICPHCIWVGETFDKVAKKYVDENKIVAYHWEWIIENQELKGVDDKLTSSYEGEMPELEQNIFSQFSPDSGVPAFVFGCKYYRIGNQFEPQKDLNKEEAEFTRIIEELIKE